MDPDAIKRSLAGSGLRSTPQRYAVMAFLMEQADTELCARIDGGGRGEQWCYAPVH